MNWLSTAAAAAAAAGAEAGAVAAAPAAAGEDGAIKRLALASSSWRDTAKGAQDHLPGSAHARIGIGSADSAPALRLTSPYPFPSSPRNRLKSRVLPRASTALAVGAATATAANVDFWTATPCGEKESASIKTMEMAARQGPLERAS